MFTVQFWQSEMKNDLTWGKSLIKAQNADCRQYSETGQDYKQNRCTTKDKQQNKKQAVSDHLETSSRCNDEMMISDVCHAVC